jgi:hypothetical protein
MTDSLTPNMRKRTFPRIIVENSDIENGVLLRRFAHQVAGRNPLYCFDNETVCKPLNMREAEFYNSRGFKKRLQRFTPRYHGSTVAVTNGSDVIAIDESITGRRAGRASETGSSCSSDDDDELISEEDDLSPWSAKIHEKIPSEIQQKIGKSWQLEWMTR